jgi:O-antigen/teichoic acid export membrane protein
MRKLEKLQIIKSVSSSWISLATNVLVGFFLSPFILHRLGDAAFGIWVLIFAITGYYGLFDLGIRSSIVRYVAKARATGDLQYASRILSTSLFSYTCIGLISLLITVVMSTFLERLFSIPAEFHSTARWLLLMVGASVSLGFPLGISGGILEGLQEFSLLNWTNIASTLLRAVLIVISLKHGFGLLMVAFITVALPLITAVIRSIAAMQLMAVSIGIEYVSRAAFREIAGYSSASLIMIISARLRFKTDSIIIGAFLSAAAITYFNIGSRIVDYAGEIVESLAQIFVPMSSHSDALGDMNRLRKIFVAGNRFCALIIFPITAILVVLGKSVIEAWVGLKYVGASYPVLLILLLSTALMLCQAASGRVLMGMGRHQTWAVVTLIEGLVNIGLSIVLVRPYGIIGDAIGTAAPLVVTTTCFLPWHLCRQLQIKMATYLREAYWLPLILCVPLVIVLLLMKRWFVPHNYLQLLAHLGVAGVIYGLAVTWAFTSKRAMKVGTLHSPEPIEAALPVVETFSQEI